MMKDSIGKNRKLQIFLKILYIVSLAIFLYFLIDGFSFYETQYQQRPRHEDYRNLRPAGDFGHGIGIIGSAMMLFMLLYSVRKRSRVFGKFGTLRSWLDIHIYFGIMGPLLVILHSSFKVQGLIAVSFWSMIAVALSGILGRYLYVQIPRNFEGEEMDLSQIEEEKTKLKADLKSNFKIDESILELLDQQLTSSINYNAGIMRSILSIFVDDLKRPFKIRIIRRHIIKKFDLTDEISRKITDYGKKKSLLERKVLLLNQVQQLFHYWHVFHKPFAIIMYLIMIVHIGVAIWLGYTWI